jgi:hypothetical protein
MTFRIDISWPSDAHENLESVADIKMSVRDRVFTRLFDEAEERVRDYFRASAVGLGFWFADNWWRLRWEPIPDPRFPSTDWRMRHELSSASGDTVWPPFMIYGVGPRVIIAPIAAERTTWGRIRYLEEKPLTLSGDEFEAGIDQLFASVLRNCGEHPDAGALEILIAQLGRERGDTELAGWRRLEACLGFDPDQAPDEVIEAMVEFEDRLGAAALDEAAVASPGANSAASLNAAVHATEVSTLIVDFSAVDEVVDAFAFYGQTPWQAAEQAALHLRQVLNLGDVVRWADLGDILRTRWQNMKEATATARNLPYSAKAQEQNQRSRLALAMQPNYHRRFEVARMIGDQIWTGGKGFGVVSRAKTDRQKFQRSFAQMFLCPMAALRTIIDVNQPTSEQISKAAKHFQVQKTVITTILVNRGYLPRETMEDVLEAA